MIWGCGYASRRQHESTSLLGWNTDRGHSTVQLMECGKEDVLPNERLLPHPLSISSFDMLLILTISSSFTFSVKQCTELALSELLERRSKNRS